ncbi:MAG: carboxypeptidase-like regulatory domain-containing protein, partial [Bryobacteraceae bacterium]
MTHSLAGRALAIFALLAIFTFSGTPLAAQSLTTGDVAGVVTDPTGATIPGADVRLTSLDTGSAQSTTTNVQGYYRFTLVKPNRYKITVTKSGFETVETALVVSVGQLVTGNVSLKVGQSSQTVEVTEAPPLLSTDASNSTAFAATEVADLPAAG